jgi:HSP20 family protein
MVPDNANQQPEQKPHENASTASGKQAGTASRSEPTSGTRDQERPIQTGREGSRSTGVGRRQQTTPVYGSGTAQASPFAMMRRMADDMDRLLENFGLGRLGFGLAPTLAEDVDRDLWRGTSILDQPVWAPQVETFRRGDKLVVRADLPGLNKDDVKVEVENGVLAISGERREEHEESRDDSYRSERTYGQFYRAIPLPDGANENQCDATFKDGVLEVTVAAPKQEERKARKIPVK